MWNLFIKFFPIFMLSSNINKSPKIKAALFDLDGTLLDTEPIYDIIHQQLINEYGNKKKFDWDVKINVIGTPEKVHCKIIVDAYNISLTPEEFAKKRNELLIEPFKKCDFIPGANETTHKLKKNFNLKIAVATSSPKKAFENKTDHLKNWLNEDIDKVVTGDDKRIKNGKPSPDIFLIAAKELGIDIKNCIIFEDSISGIKAGLNSGAAIVVGIPDPHLKKQAKEIVYDKNKVKLVILDSFKDFDYDLILK